MTESDLWTSKHSPRSIDEVSSVHPDAESLLRNVAEGRLNALIHGSEGIGKTAAAKAIASEEHGEAYENSLFVLNASDFFGMTKKEIADDPRFEGFITSKRRRNSSKADLMNHVLKEVASHTTVGTGFKTLVIDNAESMRRDFQESLRRVMERHSETCQFILTTRSSSGVIPPIRSRCFSVSLGAPTRERIRDRLKQIADEEGVEYDAMGLEFVAEEADGDLREAILTLQTVASEKDVVTMSDANEVIDSVVAGDIEEVLSLSREGNFDDAVDVIDDLLIDEGFSGVEILEGLIDEVRRSEIDDTEAARIVRLIGEVEDEMSEAGGNNERIHLERLVSAIAS